MAHCVSKLGAQPAALRSRFTNTLSELINALPELVE